MKFFEEIETHRELRLISDTSSDTEVNVSVIVYSSYWSIILRWLESSIPQLSNAHIIFHMSTVQDNLM